MIPQYFRLSPTRRPAERVDMKSETIYGAKVIEFGDVNDDRPVTIDAETLAQVVEFGNQPNKGTKARFTHPNMSNDGLGRYLGRWSNFRVADNTVLADLQIAASAHDTPDGDLANYVLQLADEDPESFGVSIAPDWDIEAMQELDKELEDGERVPLRIQRLRAADIVDEPAATRGGLFSLDFSDARTIPSVVTEILNRHYSDSEPQEILDRFAEFLRRYARQKGCDNMADLTVNATGDNLEQEVVEETNLEEQVETTEELATEFPDVAEGHQAYVEAFGDRGARWYLEGRSLLECYQDRCDELEDLCCELETRLEAALNSTGEEELSATIATTEDEQKKAAKEKKRADLKKQGIDDTTARWGEAFAPKS